MRPLAKHPELLAINTATLGFQVPIEEAIDAIARAGFGGIAPWRREVEGKPVELIAKCIRHAGLKTVGYCRSTYLPAADRAAFLASVESNLRALDDAAALGAECFVMVVGGLPENSKDLVSARAQVLEGSARLAEHARTIGVRIALEPLHPMYCADRSCLSTLAQALGMARTVEPDPPPSGPGIGVVIDAYHLWWDPALSNGIIEAGRENRIFGFHVSDWLVPTTDMLNDRGMMGDGVIELAAMRQQVEAAGYTGLVEVEIFSAANWWKRPVAEILAVAKERLQTVC